VAEAWPARLPDAAGIGPARGAGETRSNRQHLTPVELTRLSNPGRHGLSSAMRGSGEHLIFSQLPCGIGCARKAHPSR